MAMHSGNLKPDQVLLLTATKATVAGGSEGRRNCPNPSAKLLNQNSPVIRAAKYTCMHGQYYPTTVRRERRQQGLTGMESREAVLTAGRTGGCRKTRQKAGGNAGTVLIARKEKDHISSGPNRFYSKRITSCRKTYREKIGHDG